MKRDEQFSDLNVSSRGFLEVTGEHLLHLLAEFCPVIRPVGPCAGCAGRALAPIALHFVRPRLFHWGRLG